MQPSPSNPPSVPFQALSLPHTFQWKIHVLHIPICDLTRLLKTFLFLGCVHAHYPTRRSLPSPLHSILDLAEHFNDSLPRLHLPMPAASSWLPERVFILLAPMNSVKHKYQQLDVKVDGLFVLIFKPPNCALQIFNPTKIQNPRPKKNKMVASHTHTEFVFTCGSSIKDLNLNYTLLVYKYKYLWRIYARMKMRKRWKHS